MDAVLIFILGLSLAQCLGPEESFTDMTNDDAILVRVPNVDHYCSFLYDEAHDQIIVGAKDHLLQFDLELHLKQKVEFPAPDDSVQNCIQSHSADDCHNFIKVLHLFRDRSGSESIVYACGTSSYEPVCFWRNAGDIMTSVADFDGRDSCPSDPHAPTTSLFNAIPSQRLLFVGTSFGNDTKQGTIRVTRMAGETLVFTTKSVQGPSKLQNAEFVGSFMSKRFVFFAFRENALEDPSNGDTSRIARVCSNADWWLYYHQVDDIVDIRSFTKARIECGEYTSVQGISFVGNGADLLFATFQSPSLEGSAVCAYRLADIETVFSGNFWCQKSSEPEDWDECQSRPTNNTNSFLTCYGRRDSHDVEDRILMEETVFPVCGGPMYETNSSKLSRLDVKPVFGGFRAVIVGDNGRIWKFIVRDCVMSLEQIWQVIPAMERSESINFLGQLFDQVYVLTNTGVIKIPQKNATTHYTSPTMLSFVSNRTQISKVHQGGRMLYSSTSFPLHIIHAPRRTVKPNLAGTVRRSFLLTLLLVVYVTVRIMVR